MEHSPRYVKPSEVPSKDQAIIESITETLEGYELYLSESTPAIRGLARALRIEDGQN